MKDLLSMFFTWYRNWLSEIGDGGRADAMLSKRNREMTDELAAAKQDNSDAAVAVLKLVVNRIRGKQMRWFDLISSAFH